MPAQALPQVFCSGLLPALVPGRSRGQCLVQDATTAQQLRWALTPSCQQQLVEAGLPELLGEGEGGLGQVPAFLVPSPTDETHATSSPPHAMNGDQQRARGARAGCSRDDATPLLPGDKDHWGGFEGSVVPTCFERVPSGDHAPAVSHREQELPFVREGASLDGEGWRREGCFAAPSSPAEAGHTGSCASGWLLITHVANKGKELTAAAHKGRQHCLRIKGTAKQEIPKTPCISGPSSQHTDP